MILKYSELTRLEMEQINKEETIVLIPLGALEQHGNQAPLGTDDIIAQAMTEYLTRALEAEDPDFPMLIFPVIPVGLSTEHKNFCGSITLKPDTYYHLLYDICIMDLRSWPCSYATAAMLLLPRYGAGNCEASWGFPHSS